MEYLRDMNRNVEAMLVLSQTGNTISHELSEELKQKVTEFVQAAKSLEDYIVAHNQGSKPLHDQVAELREILEQKNQLIIDCEQRLQNWKERLNMLKDEQQQLLYDQV